MPFDVGLKSLFGFDQEEHLLACCLPRAKSDHSVCKCKQKVASPLTGLGEMRWTVTEMKDEVRQEQRRNCTVVEDNGEVACCILKGFSLGCPLLLVQFLLVLRSIKH